LNRLLGFQSLTRRGRYWDEARDAGRFIKSVVLDPITGFGGNGVGEKGCIVDGPFANYSDNLGPGYKIGEHCIYRFVNDTLSLMAGREYIDFCYTKTTFDKFWPCAEQAPHNGGHAGVGGKMIDPIPSPGDPIFYLHHTCLDKVFWEWQAQNLSARLANIGGKNKQVNTVNVNRTDHPAFVIAVPDGEDFKGSPPLIMSNRDALPPPDAMVPLAGSPPQIPEGDPANVTTLSHVLNMYGVIANATIADVMDIRGPLLCYEYV
jgi:tyrosinase